MVTKVRMTILKWVKFLKVLFINKRKDMNLVDTDRQSLHCEYTNQNNLLNLRERKNIKEKMVGCIHLLLRLQNQSKELSLLEVSVT